MPDKECKSKCVSAGSQLAQAHSIYNAKHVTPIIYDVNIGNRVSAEDLKVPHSEQAVSKGAAGKDIIALFMTNYNSVAIVYDDGDGCCEYDSGMDTQLLSPRLRELVEEHWLPEPSSECGSRIDTRPEQREKERRRFIQTASECAKRHCPVE